jgi:hypothetical protein
LAFNTKYRVKTVSDIYGGVTIDFQKDGYSGSITEFEGVAPNAVVIRTGANTSDIANPILATRFEVVFVLQSDFAALEIATDEPFTWLVTVKDSSSNTIVVGWARPESYQEQYTAIPYTASVICSDGLDELKSFEYVEGTGLRTQWDMLRDAIEQTGIVLPYKESINIYSNGMATTTADSPLPQVQSSAETLTEQNPFEVIDKILRPYFARIFQYGGFWHIENIDQKKGSYVERVYNSAGVYQSQSTINPLVTLSKSEPNFRAFVGQSAVLSTEPSIKEARVFFRSPASTPAGGIEGFSNAGDWTDSSTLANWTKNGSFTIAQRTINREVNSVLNEFAVELVGKQTSQSENKYIESTAFAVTQADFDSMTVGFDHRMNWPSIAILGGKPILYVQIELEAGADTYYWRNEWVLNNPFKIRIDPSSRNEWQSWETTISAVPADGDIKIRIYQLVKSGSDSSTFVQITAWKFQAEVDEVLDPFFEVDSGTTVGTFNFQPYELEVFFSDGNVTVRPGTLSLVSDGSLTTTWNRRGKTDNLNLKRLLLLQFLSLYNRPSIKIQGTLHQSGKQILPFNTIQDNSSISTRKYVMQQWEMGLSNGMGNVVYRELIPDDATVTYSFRLSEFGVVPIDVFTPFFPFIPNVPEFTIPNLNGDISGQFGVNNANPSLIVQKPELTIGTLKSSEIVINAVEDSLDVSELSKTTPKALFNAWAVKATPIATDKIVIIDSADSDELKVVTGVPLTMLGQGGATTGQAVVWDGAKWAAGTVEGSKWTAVTNGIYRNGRVAIGTTTVGTDKVLDVVGKTRLKGTTFDSNVFIRDVGSSSTLGLFTTGLISINRSSALLNGQGVGWIFQENESASDFLGGFGAVKRGTSTADIVFQTWVSGVGGNSLIIRSAGGVYIGRESATFESTVEANSLQVKNRLLTSNFTGTTARYWKLGERKAATVLLDTTQYITVEVDGTVYNLALATV